MNALCFLRNGYNIIGIFILPLDRNEPEQYAANSNMPVLVRRILHSFFVCISGGTTPTVTHNFRPGFRRRSSGTHGGTVRLCVGIQQTRL